MAASQPQIVYSNVAEDSNVRGKLFDGLTFWIAQRCPLRNTYVDQVKSNGGALVSLEKQADYLIVDHMRPGCPPDSLSYTFIEDSLRNNTIAEPNNHRAGPAAGGNAVSNPRPSGKGTRIPFSIEDDKQLYTWVKDFEYRGGAIAGNEIYKQLEQVNGRHPWQSWRDRYIKQLAHKPPVGYVPVHRPPSPPTEASVSEEEQSAHEDNAPSVHEDVGDAGNAAKSPRPIKDVKPAITDIESSHNDTALFTTKDYQDLYENVEHINSVNIMDYIKGWKSWAQGTSQTAVQWRTYFETVVLPDWQKANGISQGNTQQQEETSEVEEADNEPNPPQASINPLETISEETTSEVREQVKLGGGGKELHSSLISSKKRTRSESRSEDRLEQSPSSKRLRHHDEPAPVTLVEGSARTIPTSTPVLEVPESILASNSGFNSSPKPNSSNEDGNFTPEVNSQTLVVDETSPLLGEAMGSNNQQDVENLLQGVGEGHSTADLGTPLGESTQESDTIDPSSQPKQDWSQSTDLPVEIRYPNLPGEDEIPQSTTDSNSQSLPPSSFPLAERLPERMVTDTQAVLAAETQILDLTVPEPEGGFEEDDDEDDDYDDDNDDDENGDNAASEEEEEEEENAEENDEEKTLQATEIIPSKVLPPLKYPSLPSRASSLAPSDSISEGDAQSVHGGDERDQVEIADGTDTDDSDTENESTVSSLALEEYTARWRRAGHDHPNCVSALFVTAMRPELATAVLESMADGKGIPREMRGVWTVEDDQAAEGGDARQVERVIRKHGESAYNERLKFLETWRE